MTDKPEHHPAIVELVKLLARAAAEREFKAALEKKEAKETQS